MISKSRAKGADKIQTRPCAICGNVFKPLSFAGKVCKRPECKIEAIRRKNRASSASRTEKRRRNRWVSDEELEQRLDAYFEQRRCDVPRTSYSPLVDMRRV